MVNKHKITILAITLLVGSTMPAATKWQHVKTEDGITVERVYVKGSPVLKFRARGIIDSPVVRILAVLQDIKNQKRWNKNSYDNRIVEKISDQELVVYSAAKVPWPFQDRDYVVKLKLGVDEKNRHITVSGRETKHAKAPKRKGKVRIQLMRTHWYFKPLKKHQGKKTWVEFTVHSDPGGNLPNWLINFISKYIPYKTIQNIRRLAKSEKVDQEFLKKYQRFVNWY